MTDTCPDCGEELAEPFPFCPSCGRSLAAATDDPRPNATLVPVLNVTEIGRLHLARLTLDEAGVEYVVRNLGMSESYFGVRSNPTIGETQPPLEIVVRAEDAAKARELLANLESVDDAAQSVEAPVIRSDAARPSLSDNGEVVDLFDLQSGMLLGTLGGQQFETIAGHLEQESTDDDDYYVDRATIAMLEEDGADRAALDLLRHALGTQQGLDVRWERRGKS